MRRPFTVLLAVLAIAGCKKQEAPVAPAAPGSPAAAQGGAPASAIQGKVLEQLQAQPYAYLRIQTADGERWAAVPAPGGGAELKDGAEVTVNVSMPMKDFESSTLGRKFDIVYFGELAGGSGTAPALPAQEMPAGHPDIGGAEGKMGGAVAPQHGAAMSAGAADVGDVKVPKASGPDARTVAEIFAQRGSLKEKSVTVRGKVVKYNEGIMGKNWVHLRDGTGTPDRDNDLTVTTQDTTAVGQVVVVKGIVRTDRDIGMGAPYPVILEDAKIAK
jgi:hypothetical protein